MTEAENVEARRRAVQLAGQEKALAGKYPPAKLVRPSDEALITCIASNFNVPYLTACEWLVEVAESMKQAA